MSSTQPRSATFNTDILIPALWQSILKLDPRWMWRNPVMFVVEVGAVLTLMLTIDPHVFGGAAASSGYNLLSLSFCCSPSSSPTTPKPSPKVVVERRLRR